MTNKPKDTITKQGADLEVTLSTGHKETIHVKLMSLSKMPEYLTSLDDEMGLICLCTGKSKQFAESITMDSGLELLDLIEEINGPNAQRWADRKRKRLEPYMPIAQQFTRMAAGK